MIIIKGFITILLLFIIPGLIGLIFTRFFKEDENNILLAFVIGYLVEFALCQLVAVPLIYADAKFTTLLYLYLIIITTIAIVSLFINMKRFKAIANTFGESLKKSPKLLLIISIILIGIQAYGLSGYMHEDGDDAVYVATATTSIQTNTLYKYSPSSGDLAEGEHTISRYRLGPFPMFSAIVSASIDIHPAIVSHFVFPIIFIPLVYVIYGLIANEILNGDKKKLWQFMFLLCILHIWGNYSIRTSFTFLLFRIWQGKSLLVNMIMPATILFFMKAEKNNFKFFDCLLIFITLLAGNFTTTMGVALPPLTLMLLSIAYEMSKINFKDLKENNYFLHFKNLLKCLICCSSCIIYGILFFVL